MVSHLEVLTNSYDEKVVISETTIVTLDFITYTKKKQVQLDEEGNAKVISLCRCFIAII